MRKKLIYFLISTFCVNLVFFPLAEIRDFDTCLNAGSKISVRSDILFTGYVALMMKLAMDIVSDGKTLPTPVKSAGKTSKQTTSTSDQGAVWLRGDSLTDNLYVYASTSWTNAWQQYIIPFLPAVEPAPLSSVFLRFSMCMFLLFVMLMYSLPRGATDDYIMSYEYLSRMIPARF